MSEVKSLPKREEFSKELTWDLTVIFKSDQEWENAIKDAARNKVQKFSSYKEY